MKYLLKKPKIVVIGGGTGSFVVLSGLRRYPIDLTAIVTVADSGGSTGRLRSEFGFLPVGDLRQCLAALASDSNDQYIRKILLYRFAKGEGLRGHNLGNLLLTALSELTGSEPQAVEIAAKIFRLDGKVLPITSKQINLVARYENGKLITGEHQIDEPIHRGGLRIVKLSCQPKARLYPKAKKAILQANLVVLGPGDLYTSILPNLIISGAAATLQQTKAKILYIVNLMTRFSQTHHFTARSHVAEVEKYLARKLDYILLNTEKIPTNILKLYQREKGFCVVDDLAKNKRYQVIRKKLLAAKVVDKAKGDVLQRSFLRHDSRKLARAIIKLL